MARSTNGGIARKSKNEISIESKVIEMKVVKRVIFCVIVLAISIFWLVIGNGYDQYQEVLEEMPLEKKVEQIRKKENYAKIEELPQMYLNAVISVEDHRFFQHRGIDLIAIGRACLHDIKAQDFIEGGSTITQQLAKNLYFSQEKKIMRKIAEMFMAFELEKKYEKNEILELYLNVSYFGDGYYTAKEACYGYFGKEPKEMSVAECIMLAGIPNAPSIYSLTKNPELAKQRQKQVIRKMVKYEYLTQEEAEEILNQM